MFVFNQVLGEALHITTKYFTTKEKIVMANSKVEALEAENSMLRRELITAMDSGKKKYEGTGQDLN